MRKETWLLLSAVMMASAVGLGAFGAHGLKSVVSADLLATWQTAVDYHLAHALALLALSVLALVKTDWFLTPVLLGIVLGILLFSGSLYAWVLTQWHPLVFVTPIGGSIWVITWLGLAWQVNRQCSSCHDL